MHRLVFALALAPALLATGAGAQTVSDDVTKTLWCGEAFSVIFANEKSTVTPKTQAAYDAFVAAADKLVETGTQGYLDAGYTEEQVAKVKADLVTEVTPIVTSQGKPGRYTPDVCTPILQQAVVLPPPASTPPDASLSVAPEPSAPADASSSAQ